MIKALLFDCYDVLYIPSAPEYFANLQAAYPDHTAELADLGKQADYGFITLRDLAQGIAAVTGLEATAVRKGLDGGHIHNQPLTRYIKQLRPRYKTGMVSNMSSESLAGIFTKEQLQELFDAVIISSRVGLIKPSPDIFLLAARQLGVDTSECLFVDDQPANCDGARAVGMQAIAYTGFSQLEKQLGELFGPTAT